MNHPNRDSINSEMLHYEIKKILETRPENEAKQLHTLLTEAGDNLSSMTAEDFQLLAACFQTVLIAIGRQNQTLEHKLHFQACKLIEKNLALKKKIEEINHSKQQLQEREAKLNSIFNAAVEGIITIDQKGNIVTVNASVKSIFGYNEEELIGHNISKLMPVEHAKKHDGYIKNYLKTRIPKVIGSIREVEGMRKDGSSVFLDLSLAEFTIKDEHCFTAILRDVSLRKRQEQRDKERLEELAHVSRLGLMGEMASGIAHEVNQPLTAICAYTQVCLDLIHSGGGDQKQLAAIMDKTNEQALRAGQIIHRMRDFARSKTYHRSSIDINHLIQGCLSLCASDIKQNGITLKFNPATNLPTVYIDEIQIEQVLINLIRNSLDALKELPQSLPRLLAIRISANNQNDIEVSVKDNGLGITESEQAKILTPFYTTKTNGTGMGLSISRSIVKAHHGTLRFNSKPGKGSTFYFTLPSGRHRNDL